MGMISEHLKGLEELVNGWEGRPSWDEYFMGAALLIASRSACERLRVGCVMVSAGTCPNRIIAAGYTGFLPGAPHTSRLRNDHEQSTVHAEQNAVADAARRGVVLDGAVVYITHMPCVNCAKSLAASGISAIKYLHDYRNDAIACELLAEVGVAIRQL